jgi:uncharacterized damage-inducible protein DinB
MDKSTLGRYSVTNRNSIPGSGGERVTRDEFYECVMDAYRPAKALIGMAPADKLEWRPGPNFMSVGQVICHLVDGMGGDLRCLFTGEWPTTSMEQMAEMMKLENRPSCGVAEALNKLENDKAVLREFLDGISEEDFAHKPVSTPWGMQGKMEPMSIAFLGHFLNHKMQLFIYLKLLGLPVDTGTLYFGEAMK